MQGWIGKILEVDLSSGRIESRPLDAEMARLFLGGRGLGARLLWDMVGPEVDPLSPENVLIFCTGPLTATAFQTSNRFSVSTKSPLTGTILDANSGGFWGMRLKRSGLDALIVKGRADKPVYLEITPGGATAEGRLPSLGQRRCRETTRELGQAIGAQRPLHRAGGREARAHRRHHERRQARPRPRRHRRGHGFEEPEGDRRRG